MKLNVSLALLFVCFFQLSLKAQIADQAEDICPPLLGETVPDAQLKDESGATINLHDITKAKPTVLIFYRGGWCPYCNRHLSALAELEEEVVELGYQIVAISPDNPENLKKTLKDDSLNYSLYADSGSLLIQQLGIAFKANEKTKIYMAGKTKGKPTNILPVPTLMVLNTEAQILFQHINPNYKSRITKELLLAVLKSLK